MPAADFPRSLKLVLVDEGGLSDDPHDHGGRTAHGIIQREYNAYRHRKGLPEQDVWKITSEEVTEIYHESYWEPWCDKLPAGVDYLFFDDCVNTGPGRATRTFQATLGVPVDGHMGQVTIDAANRADQDKLIHNYADARRRFYRRLAQFPRYGKGWLSRVNHAEAGAIQIEHTGEAVRHELENKQEASARASSNDLAKPPVSPEVATSTAGISGMGAEIVSKLQEASSQLYAFQDTFKFVQYALIAIAVVGVGFAIYGIVHNAKTKAAVA